MKKLVKGSDGSYTVETEAQILSQVGLVLSAPFTGLAGTAQIGGHVRANTIVSFLLGAGIGATIAYPIVRKAMNVATFGKARGFLDEQHASNKESDLGSSASIL